MGEITRRALVGSGLGFLALGGLSYFGCSVMRSELVAGLDRLDVLLPDIVEPMRVGKAARRSFSLAALKAAAMSDPRLVSALGMDCALSRRNHLREAVRSDFESDRVIVCDRFVLSPTEVISAGICI